MNLILRPLNDVNDVTWSIIISLIILLFGVAYCIYRIMAIAYEELEEDEVITISGHSTNSDAIHDNTGDIEVTSDGDFF